MNNTNEKAARFASSDFFVRERATKSSVSRGKTTKSGEAVYLSPV